MEPRDPIELLIERGAYREAVDACAHAHGAALGRVCMALLGSQAEAEEVVQEVLILAYQTLPQFRGEGSVRAFLFGIARKMCARVVETRVRREKRLRVVHDAGEASEPPDEAVEAKRRMERLCDALSELRPSDREAVLLRFVGGLSYQEIAETLVIEEVAARQRISRALVRLRGLME